MPKDDNDAHELEAADARICDLNKMNRAFY